MEIKICNINKSTINKIDQLANEIYGNEKDFRNKFLKTKLEEIAFKKERNQLELQYQSLLNYLIEVIQTHSNIMSELIKGFDIDINKFYSYENICLPLDNSVPVKYSLKDIDYFKPINEKYDYMVEQTLGILDCSNKIFEVVLDKSIIDSSKFKNIQVENMKVEVKK